MADEPLCLAVVRNNVASLHQLLEQTPPSEIIEAVFKDWTPARTPSAFFADATSHAGLVTLDKSYTARPLHIAVLAGHIEVARVLLDAGADVNALDGLSRTPLECAILGLDTTEDNAEHRMYLSLEHPAHLTLLRDHLLVHPKLTRETLEAPSASGMGLTPLGLAAFLGKTRTVELLLNTGLKAQVDGRDGQQRTALMHAGKFSIYCFMRVTENLTLYHIVRQRKLEVVHTLLRYNASVLAKDIDGISALQLAMESDHEELKRLCQEAERRELSKFSSKDGTVSASPKHPPSTELDQIRLLTVSTKYAILSSLNR
jgi:hypothetical protein